MARKKEIYLYIDYKSKDLELLEKEFSCLAKHASSWNYEIVESNIDEGYAIIKQLVSNDATLEQISKDLGYLPYIKLAPYQGFCLSNGYPCNLCNELCASSGNCKYSVTI